MSYPIRARRILGAGRFEMHVFPRQKMISYVRITCATNPRLQRSFRTSSAQPLVLKLRRPSSKLSTLPKTPLCRSYHEEHIEYNPRDGNVIIGTIIATCVTIFGWHYLAMERVRKPGASSKKIMEALNSFNKNMVLSLENWRQGRYYTIITSAFTHTTPTHLALNMFALWSFGRFVVNFSGVPMFLGLYFGSAVAGSLAQLWYWEKKEIRGRRVEAYGASGAIFGIMGALACAVPRLPVGIIFIPASFPIASAAVGSVGLSVAALQYGWLPGIGHVAHMGGLAFGVFWWAIAMRKGRGIGNASKHMRGRF